MNVFVYGSLKKGYWNHDYLNVATTKFIGDGELYGHSLYHVANYPGMVKSSNPNETVHGEVYDINLITLKKLDQLENEGRTYKRVSVLVNVGGIICNVYTYLYLPEITPDMKKVEGNNWGPEVVRKRRV